MTRIFLTLAVFANLLLGAAFFLGMSIGDPRDMSMFTNRSVHFLTAICAMIFAALLHAIVLTYFIGTGRWIEETGNSYPLPEGTREANRQLKYRVIPAMVACLVLIILNLAAGAAADPGSSHAGGPIFGMPSSTVHLVLAVATVGANLAVNYLEYAAIFENGQIVENVLRAVRRIRVEKGLPV